MNSLHLVNYLANNNVHLLRISGSILFSASPSVQKFLNGKKLQHEKKPFLYRKSYTLGLFLFLV